MSSQNHPNFHAINFAVNVTRSYYKSLRNETAIEYAPDIDDEILNFIETVENKVNDAVDYNTKCEDI
jgi:hypothetical protein